MLIPWISKIKSFKKKTVITAIVFVSVFFFCFLILGQMTFAQSAPNTFEGGIEAVDQNIALSGTDIRIIISRIINVFLGLLGIIDVSLMIYAGYTWMTSGGDEGKITQAKAIIRNAVIGLIIILSAFAIVRFLFAVLDGRSGASESGDRITTNNFYGSGALGSVIKDHYPMRDQNDVPRNTSIVITFAVPVDPSSFMVNNNNSCYDSEGNSTTTCNFENGSVPYYGDCVGTVCDYLNTSTIKIINLTENSDLQVRNYVDFENPVEANVYPSYENGDVYTIVIRPLEYLGSAMENQEYVVYLSEELRQKDSTDSIFVDQYAKYYYWNFETNTELDLTPPEVESIYPSEGDIISKNSILQINFSEAVDPTMVSGSFSPTSTFDNILLNGEGEAVSGKWQITNGYKTVEFISDIACGENSCGNMMYCLPVDCPIDNQDCSNDYKILIRTALDTANVENPFEAQAFTGVYDLAMNALNNSSNDTEENLLHENVAKTYGDNKIFSSEEKPDNYLFSFIVENKVDRSRPYIQAIIPYIDAQDLEEDQEVKITFSKLMRYNSLPDSIALQEYPEHVCADAAIDTSTPKICEENERLSNPWFVLRSRNIDDTNTQTQIYHREFGPNNLDLYYLPSVSSTVQSINQNCLYPGFGPKALIEFSSDCKVIFDEQTGSIVTSTNCIGVEESANTDTACAYSDGSGNLGGNNLQASVSDCLNYLKQSTVSQSQYVEETPQQPSGASQTNPTRADYTPNY